MSLDNRYIYIIIIDAILILFLILSMIYSFKIKRDTSSGNPFELEEQSDKINYFKNTTIYYPDKAYCICGEDTYLDFCDEDLLKSGCKNIYKNEESNFVQCQEIEDKIRNENLKLKDIFELKTDSIHSSIITLIILDNVIFIIAILYFPIFEIFKKIKGEEYDEFRAKEDEKEKEMEKLNKKISLLESLKKKCNICCVILRLIFLLILVLFLISLAIIIILIIIIIVFSVACGEYNSDDTSIYLNFVECPNVNKEGFYKYTSLVDLSSHFTPFKIVQSFYIITIFICGLSTFVEKFIEK